MGLHETSSIDTSLRVLQVIFPNKEWDMITLKGLVNDSYLQKILATSIPFNPFSDSIYWGLSESGELFTKSTTWAAHVWMFKNPNHENLIGYGN